MKKVILYFRDLLATLKRIEQHLEKLSGCVKKNHGNGGDTIRTGSRYD